MTFIRDPRFVFGLLFVVFVVRPCCAAAADISVADAWVRPTIGQATVTAGYLSILNSGLESDRLIAVEADGVAKTEVHRTSMAENGVMRMRPVNGLDIPAGENVTFKQGADHLMLMGVATPLKDGDEISLTLRFERSGAIQVNAVVARRDPFS